MGWVKKKVWLVGIAILYCFLNVAGCAKYSLKEPPKGVTKQFYPTITKTNYASGKEYDWNKLKKGYGLFVFTYKIAGKSGYTIGGAAVGVKEGIRIWEHEFESDQPDTVSFLNAFTTWKRSEPSSVGTNNMFIELTNHLTPWRVHPFHPWRS